MTEPEAVQALYAELVAGWAMPEINRADPVGAKYVPITFKNERLDTSQLGPLSAWARASIIWTGAEQITQGQAPYRKWMRYGYVFVQLFVPADTGTALLALLAHDIRTALEGKGIDDDLNTREGASGNPTADKDDPRWAMQTVTVRFDFEETR